MYTHKQQQKTVFDFDASVKFFWEIIKTMEDINSQERDSVSFWATFIFGCHFSTSMWQIFLITQLVGGFPDKDLREFKIFWLFAKLHGICRGYLQENMYHFSF